MPCHTHHCEHHDSCISRVPVFQHLGTEDLLLLESITESGQYAKGSFIFREGEQCESLFVLSEGLIKLSKLSDDGKEHIIRFLFPGDFLGEFALLQQKQHYANAEVIDKAVVCRIHRSQFTPMLEQNPAMAYGFLMAMSERLQQADEWAGALHIMDVERRLAKLLIYLRDKEAGSPTKIRLPAAKKELAAMIGTTAETLSRKLAQFESANMILMDKRTIRILDDGRLRDYCTLTR